MWTHSQPSGNALTAILNSLYNSIACRYVWLLLTLEHPQYHSMRAFNANVAMVCYGDDNLLNVSPRVIDIFNQVTMAVAFETFGMIYTDEVKSGKMIPCRSIEDVGYLKRSFVYDQERKHWLAPLELDTILEIPNWIRSCVDRNAATEVNIQDAIEELALHDASVFEFWVPILTNAAEEQNLRPKVMTLYEYVESDRYAKGMLTAYA